MALELIAKDLGSEELCSITALASRQLGYFGILADAYPKQLWINQFLVL